MRDDALAQFEGLLRPITLWPFPHKKLLASLKKAKTLVVTELSYGQMLEDVRLAVEGRVPIEFLGYAGGEAPSIKELVALGRKLLKKSNRKMEIMCQLYTSTLPHPDRMSAVEALLAGTSPRHWIVEKVKDKEVVRPRLFLCPEIRAIFADHYFDAVKQLLLGWQQGLEHDSPCFLSLLPHELIVGTIAQSLSLEQFYAWKKPHLREADRDKKKRQKRNREKRAFEERQKRRGNKKPRVTQEEPVVVGYPHSLAISRRLIT